MRRRELLKAGGLLAASSILPRIAEAQEASGAHTPFAPRSGTWRRYEVTTRLTLPAGGPAQAWVPLPSVATDWTRPLGDTWTTQGEADLHRDPVYGAGLLHLRWQPGNSARTAIVVSTIEVQDRAVALDRPGDATALSEAERQLYTAPTTLIPTDGIVRRTAEQAVAGAHSDLDKARAIYAWVVENTFRKASVLGCGLGDVASMLAMGDLGGKCADINALYVGLARAVGLPARDVYGIRVAPSQFGYRSLGANSEAITKAQHCRAEVFLSRYGWVPVDPADVRKVALEEPPGHLALADAKVKAARDALFGAWEGNWMAYNTGHDLVLPGASGPPVGFLMYPEAEVAGTRLDCLDPDRFAYAIDVRSLSVT